MRAALGRINLVLGEKKEERLAGLAGLAGLAELRVRDKPQHIWDKPQHISTQKILSPLPDRASSVYVLVARERDQPQDSGESKLELKG